MQGGMILSAALVMALGCRGGGGNGEADGGDTCSHPGFPGTRICCGRGGEVPGSNCLPRSAIPACSGEGQLQHGKSLQWCCEGLSAVPRTQPTDGSVDGIACRDVELMAGNVCTYCGDGKCGSGENRCNCPKDCS